MNVLLMRVVNVLITWMVNAVMTCVLMMQMVMASMVFLPVVNVFLMWVMNVVMVTGGECDVDVGLSVLVMCMAVEAFRVRLVT